MHQWRVALLSFALLGSAEVRAADDAIAILDKAIKAHGAAEDFAKFKAAQWKVKGVMNFMGMKLEYTADYTFLRPGLFRFDMDTQFNGQKFLLTAATDGKVAWERAMGMVRNMAPKKAQAFHHSVYCMYLSTLVPLKGKEFALSATGEVMVDGKPALGVLVSCKGHPDVTLFFDKENNLLVKSQTQTWDEFTNKDVAQEVFFKDYKKKDGHLYFHKMVINRDGKDLLEEEFSNQKSLEKLDAKMFAKP